MAGAFTLLCSVAGAFTLFGSLWLGASGVRVVVAVAESIHPFFA